MGEGCFGGSAACGYPQASQGTQRSTQESRDQEAARKKLARKKEGYSAKSISLRDRSTFVIPDVQLHIRDAPLKTIAAKLMEENERPVDGALGQVSQTRARTGRNRNAGRCE